MLIACDLDRTLIPDGEEPDDGSLPEFYDYIRENDHVLAYVSGRNLPLYISAKEEYGLQDPDYFIGSVGTEMFKLNGSKMVPDERWGEHIIEVHKKWNRSSVQERVNKVDGATLQPEEVQNEFKLSYFFPLAIPESDVRLQIGQQMKEEELDDISIIYSVDPHKKLGLLDIQPRDATKLGALEFLREQLGMNSGEVVFAGDSGNDILPLTFGYKAILVRNATDDVKEQVLRIAKEKHIEDKLYIARGSGEGNGNYASGVLEGLKHFNV